MAALGLPLDRSTVARFARSENLRAGALTVLYGLPLDPSSVRLAQAKEALLVDALSTRFPHVELPKATGTARLDVFSAALLAGLAGWGGANDASTLVQRALGIADPSIDAARLALVQHALALGEGRGPRAAGMGPHAAGPEPPGDALQAGPPGDALRAGASPSGPASKVVPLSEFARRVLALAETIATPPFEDRLAIGALHDEYGRRHRDGGTLSAFKARLSEAFRARWLSLRRLDYIDAIDDDLRRRSELDVDGRSFHFVARDL